MAERINKEGRLLHENNSKSANNKEASKRSNHAAHREVTNDGRENQPCHKGNEDIEFVLKTNQRITTEIFHVVHRLLGIELEKNPTDMRPKEALGNVIRILIVVGVLVVTPMIGSPVED